MAISYRDGIAIGEIIFYVPALAIAILLAIRHGFGRNAGWLFLVLFTLARVLTGALQLATINAPPSSLVGLYIGVSILQGIGISQLELVCLGLLSRILVNINKYHTTFLSPRYSRLTQVITIVALILGIVGGVNASNSLAETGVYTVQTISQVSVALFIVVFALLVLGTIATSFSVSHAEKGEKRLLLAVALVLPFMLVKLVYSAISVLGHSASFNSLTGDPTIFLCMSFLMEVITVIIFEAMGITLRKIPKDERPLPGQPMAAENGYVPSSQAHSGGIMGWFRGKSVISNADEVEMHQSRRERRRERKRARRQWN